MTLIPEANWPVTRREYFADVSLTSSTDLRTLKDSPPKFRAIRDGLVERDDTDATLIGSAVHMGVLEPDAFARSLAHVKLDGSSTEAKWWRMVCRIIDGARNDYHASAILKSATFRERAIRWTDPETGVDCKAMLDIGSEENGFLCDVKTCVDPSPEAFSKDVANRGYHIQAAHYDAGARIVFGREFQWFFLAVGKSEPHEIVPYLLDDDAMEQGREERLRLLRDLRDRQASGDWSSRHVKRHSIATIGLPRWYRGATEVADGTS